MKLLDQHCRHLRVEMLESRTLLAGLGFEAALAEVSPAVKGSGDFTLGFNPRIGQTELFVTGASIGSVTINFDLLPSFVTALTVKSFESVTFTGNDLLTKLVATDVKTLDADGIKVDFGLYANNVGTISLASGGGIAVLSGSTTKLEIENLDNTLIISDLQTLSVQSKSPIISVVSLNSTQVVKVLYPAETVSVSGLTDSAQQVLFLPNGEQSSEEQPGSGNVVTITPSEETNNLIARLREALRAEGVGNSLAVFELMGRPEWHSSPAYSGISSHAPLETVKAPGVGIRGPQPTTAWGLLNDLPPTLGEIELEHITHTNRPPVPVIVDLVAAGAADQLPLMADSHASGVLGDLSPAEAESILASSFFHTESQILFFERLAEDPRTLKDFVLQGIADEVTPGQQTAFLLVDPKPSRSNADRNRESSLELLA